MVSIETDADAVQHTTRLEDADEDVRIAVRALGDMRSGTRSSGDETPTPTRTPALSIASTSSLPTTSLPSPAPSFSSYGYDKNEYLEDEDDEYPRAKEVQRIDPAEADLVERMSHLPLVGGALRAYEQGKASSRVVKYGAEMMESMTRPVVERLQLDGFATRQLDRYDRYRRTSRSRSPDRMQVDTDRSTSSTCVDSPRQRLPSPARPPSTTSQEVAQRSRWHTVLLEAGGLSAALSEESLRRLRYVLSWLLAATEHLDAQIVLLRDFTLQVDVAKVRRDIVQTVRGAVDVVAKYAGGGALGEGGRQRVRGFVLELPRRWATAMGDTQGPVVERESVSAAGGRARRRTGHHTHNSERGVSAGMESPLASPRIHPTKPQADEAAQRVLTLATESLDMMRGVMSVVKDSLDRADAWVERLGLQRDGVEVTDEPAGAEMREEGSVLPPSLSSTRTVSAQ